MADDLLRLTTEELLAAAAAVRDAATGTRVTFSPKVFLPLTELCRDRCGYCTFAKAPARLASPYLPPEVVLRIARAGAAAGCSEALFTLGEAPEERYPAARSWLADHGWSSTVDYLVAMCRLVVDKTGLLPHANPGALAGPELARLRQVAPSQGMMLESLRADLACHRGAPDKAPERRLTTLEAAGRLRIPYTTGILVGIGEVEADRLEALLAIAASHRRHGHVQEVIVQGFLPKAGTAMHATPPARSEDHLRAVALARLVLPPDVVVQAPPNLSDDPGRLLDAGISDWGGVSPVTIDHVNPERPWPELDGLRRITEARGFALAPRLTAHPRYVLDAGTWIDAGLRAKVLDRIDAEGLARDHAWVSGGDVTPPTLVPGPAGLRPASAVGEVLAGVLLGQEAGEDEITALFGARGPEVVSVCEVADDLRRRTVGDVVTWVSNRNINYTNVCTFKC
ncbi:MAG: 7,8-didemethyl-8-hydroxy-5-deazariboflavin synthase CofG, partial [Acidimicrobiales bacterium]